MCPEVHGDRGSLCVEQEDTGLIPSHIEGSRGLQQDLGDQRPSPL